MYRLFETNEFLKSIEKLEKQSGEFVRNKLSNYVYPQIKNEPHFGLNIKKLKGYTPDTWRYRIGDYRIFYSINEDDKIVLLLVVELRKDSYWG